MKLPALLSRLTTFVTKAAVTPIRVADWPLILESFAGAWQSHVVVDSREDLTKFSAVYACITQIAGDVAKMRLKLVEEDDRGIRGEVQGETPFRKVLQRPNSYQNGIQFVRRWLISKLLYGNTYVLKERDGRGIVVRLHILDPQRVEVLITDGGDVYYRMNQDPLAGLRVSVTVPASEVIHDRMAELWHPLVGLSPLYAGGLSATMGNRIQKNSTTLFGNMSRPGGFLKTPSKLEPEDAQKLKTEWERNYSGANSGKTAVLANGLTFEPDKGMPATDAQLVEQLKWTVEDVARCFDVPAYKIGGELPPNTSVEVLNQTYFSECLQVHAMDLETSLTEGLGLPRAYFVECDRDDLLRMDYSALVKAEGEAVKYGLKSPDEARRRLNLAPVKGGNTPYLQQQNYSLAALAKRDAKEDPFASGKPAPAAPAANDERMDEAEARSVFRMRVKGARQ